MKKNLSSALVSSVLVLLFTSALLASPVSAQGIPIGDYFDSRFGQDLGFADLVSIILSNAVALAAIIFFFLIFLGGFFIIQGAGSGNQEQTAKGKKALTAAVIGFFVVFTSYWIIKIIEMVFKIYILSPYLNL